MNIEELKLILETLNAAGSGAARIAVLWMLLGFAKSLVSPAVTCVLGVLVLRIGRDFLDKFSFIVQVAHALGTITPLTARERRECLDRIKGGPV